MLAAQLATGDCGATCRRCRTDAAYRAKWGCDGPKRDPVYALKCPRCLGAAEGCERCGGTGEELIYECPNRIVTDEDRDVVRAVVASETGMWPEAGGLNDQPLWFVRARPVVVAELEDWRRREREAAAARSKP